MFNIKDYLEKTFRSINSAESQKKQILDIIKENSEIQLASGDIEVRDYVLRVKSSPCIKNKLFMCKNKILNDISVLVPSLTIVDMK